MKRLLSILFAATLLLAPMVPGAVAAAPCTLTVVIMYGDAPLSGIHVAVCRVDTEAFAGTGADFSKLTKEKNIALAASFDAYAAANGIERSVKATDSGGKAVFAGLSPGLYLVAQADSGNSEYIIAPYLVAVNGDITASPKTEPLKKITETISVRAYKIWVGAENHPTSVRVQLYRNGQPHGAAVTLSAENYWRCAWDSLNSADTWTVDEPGVPAGYAKSVSGSVKTGFVITNSRLEPSIPIGPTEPVNPSDPSIPGITGTPGTSSTPNNPRTEDPSDMLLWIALMAFGVIGLIVVFCVLKIKRVYAG